MPRLLPPPLASCLSAHPAPPSFPLPASSGTLNTPLPHTALWPHLLSHHFLSLRHLSLRTILDDMYSIFESNKSWCIVTQGMFALLDGAGILFYFVMQPTSNPHAHPHALLLLPCLRSPIIPALRSHTPNLYVPCPPDALSMVSPSPSHSHLRFPHPPPCPDMDMFTLWEINQMVCDVYPLT